MQHPGLSDEIEEGKNRSVRRCARAGEDPASVVEGLKEAGVTKIIIIQLGQDVILFEEAENLDGAYRYLAQDAASVEWEKLIGSWMELHPQTSKGTGLRVSLRFPWSSTWRKPPVASLTIASPARRGKFFLT